MKYWNVREKPMYINVTNLNAKLVGISKPFGDNDIKA